MAGLRKPAWKTGRLEGEERRRRRRTARLYADGGVAVYRAALSGTNWRRIYLQRQHIAPVNGGCHDAQRFAPSGSTDSRTMARRYGTRAHAHLATLSRYLLYAVLLLRVVTAAGLFLPPACVDAWWRGVQRGRNSRRLVSHGISSRRLSRTYSGTVVGTLSP